MPANTATQGFTYPTSGDRACEGAAAIQLLAEQMEAKLKEVDALVESFYRPKAAVIEWDSATVMAWPTDGSQKMKMRYNTVVMDQGGLVDFATKPNSITLPLGYRYKVGTYARIKSGGFAGNVLTLNLTNNVTFSEEDLTYSIYSGTEEEALFGSWDITPTGSPLNYGSVMTQIGFPPFGDVTYARLWAFQYAVV